jgi:hypothetical protein
MQLLTATLTKPARPVTTKYGDRTVADIRLPDGTETAIWRPANDQSLANLTTGQPVTVAKDHKGKINLIESQPTPTIDNGHNLAGQLTNDQKRDIAQYITQQRDLLAFCLDQAASIPQAQTDESVEKLGVTLYLSAQKKFGLA